MLYERSSSTTTSRAPLAVTAAVMPLEERPRERGDEQRERQAPQHEQQQVPQLLPPHRPVRNPLQEHQRRKLDDVAPLAIDQVDDHRNGDRGEAGEERGGEEIPVPSHPVEALPRREEREQRLVERLRRVEQRVVGARFTDAPGERAGVLRTSSAVLRAQILRDHRHLVPVSMSMKLRGVGERELDLARVEQMEHDQVVPAPAQFASAESTASGSSYRSEIKHDDAPAAQRLGQLSQRRVEQTSAPAPASAPRGRSRSARARAARAAGAWPTAARIDDVVVERREPDAVALRAREIGEARREIAAVVELGHAPRLPLRVAAIAHRRRHVEQHDEVRVRVRLELLHVVAVAPRVQAPVDAPDVVARHVRAMLGEVGGRPEVRRPMQAVDEPLDDDLREQLQIPDPGEDRGIEKAGGLGRDGGCHVCHRLHPRPGQRHGARAACR